MYVTAELGLKYKIFIELITYKLLEGTTDFQVSVRVLM